MILMTVESDDTKAGLWKLDGTTAFKGSLAKLRGRTDFFASINHESRSQYRIIRVTRHETRYILLGEVGKMTF